MPNTRTRVLIGVAAVVIALATASSVYLAIRPSYDDHVNACVTALSERPQGDTAKPGSCDPLTRDDYMALVFSQIGHEEGWIDEDGDVDMGELIEDSAP